MFKARFIKLENIKNINESIPASDFVNVQFDNSYKSGHSTASSKTIQTQAFTKKIALILSTPRSGSTYLSHLLHTNSYCTAHEYFQTFQYMPILSKRWNCLENNKVDIQRYAQALKYYRTSTQGILGIKLHGRHLSTYEKFAPYFAALPTTCIVLTRSNLGAQAVSYEIASQTAKWTHDYKSSNVPIYSFDAVLHRLQSIQSQNLQITKFLRKTNIEYAEINYENLISSPSETLSHAGLDAIADRVKHNVNIKLHQQTTSINNEWQARFMEDLHCHNRQTKQRIRKAFTRILK